MCNFKPIAFALLHLFKSYGSVPGDEFQNMLKKKKKNKKYAKIFYGIKKMLNFLNVTELFSAYTYIFIYLLHVYVFVLFRK